MGDGLSETLANAFAQQAMGAGMSVCRRYVPLAGTDGQEGVCKRIDYEVCLEMCSGESIKSCPVRLNHAFGDLT